MQCNNISHPHTDRRFPITSVITCSFTHVVHMLHCPCGLSYAGKTTRKLKYHISEVKSAEMTLTTMLEFI